LRRRSKNPNVPIGTRRSIRQLSRGTLHIADEPEIQEENNTSSDDGEESDPNYHESPPHGTKRSGRQMRSSSSSGGHGVGSGSAQPDEEAEEEGQQQQSGQPLFVTGVMMRKPSVPHDYIMTDYMKRGMTDKVRKERLKNPLHAKKGRSVDYRFQTKFHQDFYVSAILSKKYKVARSQFMNWPKLERMGDPIFNEIISACKAKHIYKIMAFQYDWNIEVIAQFYATCHFETHDDMRWVHWMTEGKWYKINYAEFAVMFGFGRADAERVRLHLSSPLPKEEMKCMYLPGRESEFGGPKGLIPFYAYLNKFFRKTLAPREGDAHNISSYGKNLLYALTPSEPEFSVFDYIWEEIKSISESPQKCCGFGAYLMFMIDQKTNKRFECDYKHPPVDVKMDSHPGPTLAEIIASREQDATPDDGDTVPHAPTHAPSAPHVPTRSYSRRGGSRSQNWEKPPSPIRKMFNMIFGMCKSTNDVVHKERERRKKDTLRLKKLQEAMLPNDPPSPIGSEGQQSEPESMEQMNARYQQEDYWGQLYGSGTTSLVNPTQFPPPPPSYGFDAYGAWMFDHHVGDAGQGSSRQDERQDDEDNDQ